MQILLFSAQALSLKELWQRIGPKSMPQGPDIRLDPTSQFVRSFLGSRTYDAVSWRVFERLARLCQSWDALARLPADILQNAITEVTHAEKKAPELKQALIQIRARAGAVDLSFLEDLPVDTALLWLEQIHGVGRKIAAATLNFSTLCKRAFVIDTHVLRVLRRFGFVAPKADNYAVYHAVMDCAESFDAQDLYELHCALKRIGQTVCTDKWVACHRCHISDLCLKRLEAGVFVMLSNDHAA